MSELNEGSNTICVYKGCRNNKKVQHYLTFFQIRKHLKEDWFRRIGKPEWLELPQGEQNLMCLRNFVCSEHFPREYFANSLRKHLYRNAVPLHCDGSDIDMPKMPLSVLRSGISNNLPTDEIRVAPDIVKGTEKNIKQIKTYNVEVTKRKPSGNYSPSVGNNGPGPLKAAECKSDEVTTTEIISRPKIGQTEPTNPLKSCDVNCPKAIGLFPSMQCCTCFSFYHSVCVQDSVTPRRDSVFECRNCILERSLKRLAKSNVGKNKEEKSLDSFISQSDIITDDTDVGSISVVEPTRSLLLGRTVDFKAPPSTLLNDDDYLDTEECFATPLQQIEIRKTPCSDTATTPVKRMRPNPVIIERQIVSSMDLFYQTFSSLIKIFKYLPIPDLLRAARVCRTWESATRNYSLWQTAQLKEVHVSDATACLDALRRRYTQNVDCRCMAKSMTVDLKDQLHSKLVRLKTMQRLDVDNMCSLRLQHILSKCVNLRICNATITRTNSLRLDMFTRSHRLRELRVRCKASIPFRILSIRMGPLCQFLRVLHLFSFQNWNDASVENLLAIKSLTDLGIGDCTKLPVHFGRLLQRHRKLERIRLEAINGKCETLELLNSMKALPRLHTIELINFRVQYNLEVCFKEMNSLKRLLVVPDLSDVTLPSINIMLRSVYSLQLQLEVFMWIFTTDLVESVRKLDPAFHSEHPDIDALPVPKPIMLPRNVPNPSQFFKLTRMTEKSNCSVSIVPMSEMKEMLVHALPNTKVHLFRSDFDKIVEYSIDNHSHDNKA